VGTGVVGTVHGTLEQGRWVGAGVGYTPADTGRGRGGAWGRRRLEGRWL